MLKIIECPRDAMQGIKAFVPTETKVNYLKKIFKVGFDTIDCGSFVSAKAIPQMQDTAQVLDAIDENSTKSKLLVIIANPRGAEDAVKFKQVTYLGYPFSISETFQQRNTNRGIEQAFEDVKLIQEMCLKGNKELVTYISMGFGNPYNDPWNTEIVMEWVEKLSGIGVKIFSLSDTVGAAKAEDISKLFSNLILSYPTLEFGAHFHSRPEEQLKKIKAAYDGGCRRFDSALLGYGGCPMAKDELVGNTATEVMLAYFEKEGIETGLDRKAFEEAKAMAGEIFGRYH